MFSGIQRRFTSDPFFFFKCRMGNVDFFFVASAKKYRISEESAMNLQSELGQAHQFQ